MTSQQEATIDHIKIMVRILIMIELSPTNKGRIPIKPYVTARIVTIPFKFIFYSFPIRPWGRNAKVIRSNVKMAILMYIIPKVYPTKASSIPIIKAA